MGFNSAFKGLKQALQTLAIDKVHFRVPHDYTSKLLNITDLVQ